VRGTVLSGRLMVHVERIDGRRGALRGLADAEIGE
jgi:hypothetical protein